MERFKSLNEIFSELQRPAGHFHVPLSFRDRLLIRGGRLFSSILQKYTGELFIWDTEPFIPAQWKTILTYLHKEGVLATPRAHIVELSGKGMSIPHAHLTPAPLAGRTDGEDNHARFSDGSSLDVEEAISKAIGELLERYPLLLYREKNLLYESAYSLRQKNRAFLNPSLVSTFTKMQMERLPYRHFDETSIFGWVEGFSATRNQTVLIPAQLIYWNYQLKNEPRLRQPNTNGMAGFFTREQAVLAGLYELLHRDGFLIHWLTKTPPPQIDLNSIKNVEIQALIEECKSKNLEIYLFDVAIDIPAFSVACAIINRHGKPAVSVGGGGGQDLVTAIYQAILETITVHSWLSANTRSFELPESFEPFFTPIRQTERVLLWSNLSMLKYFEFFLKGATRPLSECLSRFGNIPETPKERLRFYADTLAQKGAAYELLWFEAIHPTLQTLGYHSVHVVVPALFPLYLTEPYAPLGAQRLQWFQETRIANKDAPLNPIPQPFA